MLGNSIDNLQITLLDDLTTTLKVTDCQKVMVLQSEMAKARRSYADQQTIEGYVNQLNQYISGSMTCAHQNMVIPMRLTTTIRDAAFYNCTSLQKVSFPESVTKIETSVFYQCASLESIILPPNITEVATALFFQCTSLRSVTIPAAVTNIGLTPFLECNKLTEITCLATTPPTLHMMAFLQMAQADITLYVPEEAVETYKATPMWKNFNVQPLAGTGISISEEFRVKSEEFATAPGWYSLDGRRLDGKPAQSGIYVNGERKVVIK